MADDQPRSVNKIVLSFGDGMASIGVSAAECDPYFDVVTLVQGDDALTPLEQVLDRLPEVIEAAQERWQGQARNPTYDRPVPQIQPALGRTGRQTRARPSGPTQQSLL
ncbi:MAG TPA: hypothetical protein VFR55_05465 [Dehalococcoidia bacterium]|nr:hypothetical protein [Dehalococcoidia bacterium]